MMNKVYQKIISGVVVCLIVTGCKTFQPVVTPAAKSIPASFSAAAHDSISIADLSWREYFNDASLVSLIDSALLSNTDLQIAWQRIEAAKAGFLKSKSALLPGVNGVASIGLDKYGNYTMTGVGNFDTNLSANINDKQRVTQPLVQDYFAGIRSNWELDIWGKLKNAKNAAAARLLASEKGRQFVVTNLVSGIATDYYSLLALDNQLRIIRRNIKYQQDALEIVKVMLQSGRGTALAVQQFQAQLYSTQSYEYSTRQRIVDIEAHLNTLLGRYPQSITRDSATLVKPLPAIVHAGLPAGMIGKRPDVLQAELELQATKFDVASAKAAALPSLSVTPYFGLNAFKGNVFLTAGSITYGLLGGVTAPVFNRKEIKANYQFAGASQREAFFRYQQSLVNSFSEVYTGLSDIENKRQVQKLKELEVTELQSGVSTANDLYVAGYASYLEVITAQKSVLQAEFELNDTRKDVWLSMIQLYRALGGGWK